MVADVLVGVKSVVTQEEGPEIIANSEGRDKEKERVVEQRGKHGEFRIGLRQKKTEENGIWGCRKKGYPWARRTILFVSSRNKEIVKTETYRDKG